MLNRYVLVTLTRIYHGNTRTPFIAITRVPFVFQLFRRVAAALPGMDSTENKPPEDSILSIRYVMYTFA